MSAAVDALEAAFSAASLPVSPQRLVLEREGSQLLAMPAAGPQGTGTKLVTVQPSNADRGLPLIHGVYVLFAAETMAPRAFFDGAELTTLRTPAVSALATTYLARDGASRLVVFGAGVQARAHVEAMRAVREITDVTIVAPTDQRADRLVQDLGREGLAVRRGSGNEVSRADIVCTCTTASEPVLSGEQLPEGVHVNAIGSYQPHTREVDTATCLRARVVVEDRDAVLAEAGDLTIPLGEGSFTEDRIAADLHEVVRGRQVRTADSDITLFKSVGLASEDLVVAAAALDRLASGGRGS